MKRQRKVSNARYVGIATSCFCMTFCLALARSMLPGFQPIETPKKPEKRSNLRAAAQPFRQPQVLNIKPPTLVRSVFATQPIADFSDNGVLLLVTSDRGASVRTYEIVENGKSTPLTNVDPTTPVALSPQGKPFQRPSLYPGRNGSPPTRVGQSGPGTIWSPAMAGARYLRRFYEDGSYLVAFPERRDGQTMHTVARIKDGKYIEKMTYIKDFQGIIERTSDDALWIASGRTGRAKEMNVALSRYHKGATKKYPVPDKYTLVNRLSEGGGVIAAGMFNVKLKSNEQILTFAKGKWTPLPLPQGLLSARLTKVFDTGWVLGECDDLDRSVALTVLWKDNVPIILNDLPGWPKNGISATVVGASHNGDIYVRNFVGSTYGSEEYYLIHLRE